MQFLNDNLTLREHTSNLDLPDKDKYFQELNNEEKSSTTVRNTELFVINSFNLSFIFYLLTRMKYLKLSLMFLMAN